MKLPQDEERGDWFFHNQQDTVAEALSKKNDPDTSREAGKRYDKSHKRTIHFQQILITMSDLFPFTSAEIARWSPLDRFQVARRLPEMERFGLVSRGNKKYCSVVKQDCVGWKLTAAGKDRIN